MTTRHRVETTLPCPIRQTKAAYFKYKEAIIACQDIRYIEYNVSQIAEIYNLNPSCLSHQLRRHFPHILEARETQRKKLNLHDNFHRGASPIIRSQYSEAIEHLNKSDDTIAQTAKLFNLSYPGLRDHMLAYYKDLAHRREQKRKLAVELRKQEVMAEKMERQIPSKRYFQSTVEKYAEAIEYLKSKAATTVEAAKRFNLHPDCFREYLYVHEPELASRHGMITLPNGKRSLARSARKYDKAIRIYRNSNETLKSIAERLDIPYKSLSGYIRRNHPDAIMVHNNMLSK